MGLRRQKPSVVPLEAVCAGPRRDRPLWAPGPQCVCRAVLRNGGSVGRGGLGLPSPPRLLQSPVRLKSCCLGGTAGAFSVPLWVPPPREPLSNPSWVSGF